MLFDPSTAWLSLLFVSASLAAIEEDAAFDEDSSANDDDLALDDSIDSETAFLLSAIVDCLSFDDFLAVLSERASADFLSLELLFAHAVSEIHANAEKTIIFIFFNIIYPIPLIFVSRRYHILGSETHDFYCRGYL